jgi:hypothetical protein
MRVVIRHAETGLFLSGGTHWTPDPERAMSFVSEVRAQDYRIYRRLTQTAVVVLRDGDPGGLGQPPPVTPPAATSEPAQDPPPAIGIPADQPA